MQTATNTIAVLLVEDSRVDMEITKAQLEENNDLKCYHAPLFNQAMEMLEHQKFDAVVLDLGLPDSSGEDSVLFLKKKYPNMPLIILSGHTEEVAVMRALHYGADAFLLKTKTQPGELRKYIFEVIFRKSLRKHA